MADLPIVEQAQTVSPAVSVAPEVKTSVSIDEFNALKNALDNIKAAQSGSDRRVSELTKENEELKKSQMSEKERQAYEKQIIDQERQSFERARKELESERMKFKFLAENKIEPEAVAFLNADSEEGLKKQLDSLNAFAAAKMKPLIEELNALKAAGSRPGGGNGPNAPADAKAKMAEAQAKFQAAVISGDVAAQKAAADEAFYWQEMATKSK